MKLDTVKAGAFATGPNQNCVLNNAAYSKNHRNLQGSMVPLQPPVESGIDLDTYCNGLVPDYFSEGCHWVKGELGPIQVIGSPIVFVGLRRDCTIVWVCATRLPRGWSDPRRTFLCKPGSSRKGAFTYALQLAEYVRKAAEKEAAYRQRQKEAYRFGGEA